MNLFGFKKTLNNAVSSDRRKTFLLAAMVASNLMLVLYTIFKSEIVILQPPELFETAKITKKNATQNYYTTWALAIAELVGNASPSNIEFVKDQIQMLATSDLYASISAGIDKEVQKIKDDQVAQRFEARGVSFEPETDKLFVYGKLIGIGIMGNEASHEFTYEIRLAINFYRVKLIAMRGYSGRPMTLDRMQEKEATEERLKKNQKPEDKGNQK
ncbi:MAG: hypothetical protein F8N36_15930 [Desulfovibrio sp.]|uniref:TraE/TraK family type IV conjugative transfer system protein n=1 Tax=Desulfovibrio sp. TaxID=885 RepID=UPI00135DF4E2|nr:TraE/TraK family type IV conjugative transfer system protein [Desulfovibrio sp.]MTJ94328.1 hypothetical protein [Desulfovibrio sp.]